MLIRLRLAAFAAVILASSAAWALSLDPKAVARFDFSFTKCEAMNPAMRGRRDEAYLSLYRIKADAKSRAELAALRKGAPYQAESKRARDDDAKKPAAKETLELQCRALWGETQRLRATSPQ